jgi:hypothetical protein
MKLGALGVLGLLLMMVLWENPVESLVRALLPLYLAGLGVVGLLRLVSLNPSRYEQVRSLPLLTVKQIQAGLDWLASCKHGTAVLVLLLLLPISDTLVLVIAGLILGGELIGLPMLNKAD